MFTVSFPNAKYNFSPPYCYQINFSWAPMVPDVLDLKPISRWSDISLCMWITVGGSLCVLKRIQDNHRKHTRQREHTQWFWADSLDEHLMPGAGFGPLCLIPSLLHSNEVFFALILYNSVFHAVSGSGLPSLALPDDLFLPRLETCSHSFFTCVFFCSFFEKKKC